MRSGARPIAVASVTAVLVLTACAGGAAPSVSTEPSPPTQPTASPSAEDAVGAMVRRSIGSEGAPMGYLEYLPPGYGDGEPRPLLVFLHGSGEAGDGTDAALEPVATLGIPPLIEAGDWPEDRPFVVLAPQYPTERTEADCALAEDVADFLDFAMEQYEVDATRVYLTGISCGAIGVWDYLGAHGDEVVAAAVPISGHAEWAFEAYGCAAGRVPVWAFHGAQDEIVPTVHIEEPMDQIRDCTDPAPAEMTLTVYPDREHDAWIPAYDLSAGDDPYAWLLEQVND